MFKKLALFLFTAAATLSASVATALPPPCEAACMYQYRACIKRLPVEVCAERQNICLESCP